MLLSCPVLGKMTIIKRQKGGGGGGGGMGGGRACREGKRVSNEKLPTRLTLSV